jgi:hypothetical protein
LIILVCSKQRSVGFAQKVLEGLAQISYAKAQRRTALPRFNGFLCAFAPLRGNLSLAKAISKLFVQSP